MDAHERRDRIRSFVLGGLVGAAGAFAAVRRLRAPAKRARNAPVGLGAFEDAPCFHELAERRAAARGDGARTRPD